MKDKLNSIKDSALQDIKNAKDLKQLNEIKVKFLGKKGELTKVLRNMGKLPKEERPIMGKLANEVREAIENEVTKIEEKLKDELQKAKLESEKIDISMPGKNVPLGHRHPLIQVKEELENVFQNMGFDIVEGPEIETVDNNFDALNAPENHPSRDMSDTFYITNKILLRTQTSPVQVRVMKQVKPPIKIVSAGRCFRFDDVDDTHSPMFHQLECLVVDEGITLANLKHTINVFVKELFGEDIKTRFRPHYFPFTEPSAEVDVSCLECKGKGCKACNGTGWSMEILGCGMVHPKVLENCGIDSEVYSGFAFGLGIDRLTMAKYEIDNIRLLFENDMRFIKQF
ncbi:MAG: phenylalanine--tRNA ligase subunit alpha [Firmicutes bacterium]|nr:phenylalanine--tRNA ligase subunit alpha [Bacillota bacterium]MTI69781.1 phenylalanine--tRNA ligase subunit alpha [Bacillota bacterium]